MVIRAVYEDGVFKPLEHIEIPNGTPAEVSLQPEESSAPENLPESSSQELNIDWTWRSLGLITYVSPDFDETPEEFSSYTR